MVLPAIRSEGRGDLIKREAQTGERLRSG